MSECSAKGTCSSIFYKLSFENFLFQKKAFFFCLANIFLGQPAISYTSVWKVVWAG
jgi:hypothetical protein